MIHIYYTTNVRFFKSFISSRVYEDYSWWFPEIDDGKPVGQLQFCRGLLKELMQYQEASYPKPSYRIFTLNPLIFGFLKVVIQCGIIPSNKVDLYTVYENKINYIQFDYRGDIISVDGMCDEELSFDFHCRFNPHDMLELFNES